MRTLIVGLGIQGNKRLKIAGSDAVGTVDPFKPEATYKSLLDIPLERYDAVCLCTPDQSKIELISYLLKSKKHVMVEKPLLSKNSSELEFLHKLAKENQVTCYTAYNHRFEPHIVNLKKVIDAGKIGKLFSIQSFYGNGTARDVYLSEWRDKEMGVLSDLGSHLLDLYLYLFENRNLELELHRAFCHENRAPDQVIICSKGKPYIQMEMTLLSWRNSFQYKVVGDKGSASIECLCKWGPSTLTVHERVLPSGRPPESKECLEMPDPTWEKEWDHFKKLCQDSKTNLENDIWINNQLNQLFSKFS